jgi:hypothetical protein
MCIRAGDTATVKCLLSAGVEHDGRNALHHAVQLASTAPDAARDIIKYLMVAGVERNRKDKEGKTPLEIAMALNIPSVHELVMQGVRSIARADKQRMEEEIQASLPKKKTATGAGPTGKPGDSVPQAAGKDIQTTIPATLASPPRRDPSLSSSTAATAAFSTTREPSISSSMSTTTVKLSAGPAPVPAPASAPVPAASHSATVQASSGGAGSVPRPPAAVTVNIAQNNAAEMSPALPTCYVCKCAILIPGNMAVTSPEAVRRIVTHVFHCIASA